MTTRRALLGTILASPALAQSAPDAPLRIATGAPGGTFHDYGAALAALLVRAGVPAVANPTGGSIENLRALADGRADCGLVAMGPAYDAWNATPPIRSVRAVMPMYETPFHLVATIVSGMRTIGDLDRKRVGVGPRGGPNEIIFARLAQGVGIRTTSVTGDPAALGKRVTEGELDALFFGAGIPVPAIVAMTRATSVRFIPLDGDAARALVAAFPYLAENAIPAHAYAGQEAAVPTVTLWNFLLAREGLEPDRVAAVVRALLADPAATAAMHPAAAATTASNLAADTFLSFHPGAVAALSAAGATVPAALR